MIVVGYHAPCVRVADVVSDAIADGGEVEPDIRLDRIAVFVVCPLVAVNVAELDFGKKVVVLPSSFSPDSNGDFFADSVGRNGAVGVVRVGGIFRAREA